MVIVYKAGHFQECILSDVTCDVLSLIPNISYIKVGECIIRLLQNKSTKQAVLHVE